LPALSHVGRLLLSLSLFTSQLIIVFFVLRGVVAAAVRVAVAAVGALPLRSRPAALAAASKTGDIAMVICSDLGQKSITFSANQEAADQDVAAADAGAAAAAAADDVAVAPGPATTKTESGRESS